MWQIVVFIDLAKHFVEGVKVVAQEPAYTDLDRVFLQTLHIEALEVDFEKGSGLGQAGKHLGKEAFVFEPFLDMDAVMMKEIVEADVALYVGSSIRGLMSRTNEVGALAKKFSESHRMYNFPEFEVDPNVLGGMGIYWKEEQEDET